MNKKLLSILLLGCFICSCSSKKDESLADPPIAAATPAPVSAVTAKCVQVFYDKETPSNELQKNFGKAYATMTANLLGHFKDYEIRQIEIADYKSGDLERCKASIYLGSDYYSYVPDAFIQDYKSTQKNVAWVGYSFWDLDADLDRIFGLAFEEFTVLDEVNKADDGKPSFFRDIRYKGEVFRKYGEWNKDRSKFLASFELAKLKVIRPSQSQILASAKHSLRSEEIPWAARAGNHFLITEIPLSYIHESDRYLVFADLLFDILDEKPRREEKLALLRLEDVHAYIEIPLLRQAVEILRNEGIVPHISLIPIFKDPFGDVLAQPSNQEVEISQVPEFMRALNEIKSRGATFIWHGVTHQYKSEKNPFSGASGDDFEFWDAKQNAPIAEDSEAYVANLLNHGRQALQRAGIETDLWLTPHYQASPLDNQIFGRVFRWNLGRMIYLYENNVVGQFFPYEIHGDVYGQKIIPENLGNVQPELNEQVVRTRSVEEILEDARRNLVLRDSWASAFYHPFLLEGQDAANTDLQILVRGLKKLGYRFVNLKGSF